jgi:ligand-binding sensor domain-containing protein/signal transduction histidine kinase
VPPISKEPEALTFVKINEPMSRAPGSSWELRINKFLLGCALVVRRWVLWLRLARCFPVKTALLGGLFSSIGLLSAQLYPLDPEKHVSECIHTAWGIQDGSVLTALLQIAQTSDHVKAGVIASHFNSGGLQQFRQISERHEGSLRMARGTQASVRNLKFTHLTTKDGLSQGYVTAILQDRRGFMWFATRDGLNRYDGNAFVEYKNNPNDPWSLSSNFIQDLIEDQEGYLWIATNTGVDRFDPTIDRFTRYLHDPNNPNSMGGASVKSIAQDDRGYLWFGTEDGGLEKLDPTNGNFTHYRNDSDGHFVGRITQVIADHRGDIWFVGERGLFYLNRGTTEITHPPATKNVLSATSVYEDESGNVWMLADSPLAGLVKYDRQAERLTTYPFAARTVAALASTTNGGSANSTLAANGQNGFWVASSLGLYYFDRRAQRYTRRFEHEESNPDTLDSNAIMSVYQDKGGVLWIGTENSGVNILNFRQEQFGLQQHRPGDRNSISPGRVKAIYQDSDGVLWVGLFPRALDRLDRKTGEIRHYVPKPGDKDTLGAGTNVNSIYKDPAGYLWVGGGGGGLDRVDERTGRVKHYRHNSDDPNSLISNNLYTIYGDRNGHIWVGQEGGLSRFEPAKDGFTNYRPIPDNPASFANTVWAIYQDRSGTLWAGTWGGVLIRFDEAAANPFVNYTPDARDPHQLNGGGINTIHEDRMGRLWLGTFDGLYRYNRNNGTFIRYTETQGLPSSAIRCILEDGDGRLWLSTDKGISRLDPQKDTFRNYDLSDGLQSNEFSTGCYQSPDGEMFFGGSNGFNAFFAENIRDNPYVPPIVITSFKIFNKPVSIGTHSVLKKAISYADSLTLSYRDNEFSFEFAALSYANSQKNHYRYKLENFEPGWNQVDSKQRLATYTNLDPGKYIFRVQGSNSDGVWNEEGVSLPILISPPWWKTNWFRAICAVAVLCLLLGTYQVRLQQLHQQFSMTLEARVLERTRIARDLHDTLLQSFHGVLLYLQTISNELPAGNTKEKLDTVITQAEQAIVEGRGAVQGLRTSTVERNDLGLAIRALGEEVAAADTRARRPDFTVQVEGAPRNLHPITRDEVYRITGEAMRNAFRHADAKRIEVEIRYDHRQLRARVRDNGKGIDRQLISGDGRQGHFGLRGMQERAKLIGGKLTVWSEPDSGTEVELIIPAARAYLTSPARHRSWFFEKFAGRSSNKDPELKS